MIGIVVCALYACSDSGSTDAPVGAATNSPADAQAPATSTESEAASGPVVLFLGDSLSAGLHLSEEQAFPAVLQRRSKAAGHPFRLINAGISGDTTAGGVSRLAWSLKSKPDVVVLELGANDGLRGIELSSIRANLVQMIEEIRASGARVLLLGMKLPPNYGPAYTEGYEAIFDSLAAEYELAYVPYFLAGVGEVPRMNLPDGLHPTAEGHERVADNIAPVLWSLLETLP